jgi:hypothetical protein
LAMAEPLIRVQGDGIAARCSLQLLQQQGAADAVGEGGRPKLPALVISQSTQGLLADIFRAKDLLQGLPTIRKRFVAWGSGEPVVLPHSAVVASEHILLERLRARNTGTMDRKVPDPLWTIIASRTVDKSPVEMHFGSRNASVREVELIPEAEPDACWVESVENGWLFLVATGDGRASLISAGDETEQLLDKSRLAARQVRKVDNRVVAEFPVYPRILSNLCGSGWLACGTAAMSFDPLCGEGAGHAAREAILACAAVRAILAGESAAEVLTEYSLRLMLGFLRHLENCRDFYLRDSPSAFWSSELRLIEQGIAWAKDRLSAAPPPKFRLMGFALERNHPAERT